MKHLYIILLIFISTCIFSQNQKSKLEDSITKRNTIYFEFLGQGIVNSLNFDRIHIQKRKFSTSLTVGISHWGYLYSYLMDDNMRVTSLPISYNILLGSKNHKLELGLGLTESYIYSEYTSIENLATVYENPIYFNAFKRFEDLETYLNLKLGYRYQRMNGGFFFRTSLTPIFPIFSYTKTTFNTYGTLIQETKVESTISNFIPIYGGISFGYTLKK